MRHLAPVALLALLSTFAVAVVPKDVPATNTQQTLFSQQTPTTRPTSRPTTTPTRNPGM
jgi:hypothetical protein